MTMNLFNVALHKGVTALANQLTHNDATNPNHLRQRFTKLCQLETIIAVHGVVLAPSTAKLVKQEKARIERIIRNLYQS